MSSSILPDTYRFGCFAQGLGGYVLAVVLVKNATFPLMG